jgi:Na+-driven multidrug efflux pump
MIIILLFCEKVLLKVGLDPESCRYAGIYTYANIPGMFFLCQFDAIRNYLNTMNKSSVIMTSTMAAAALHLFWVYLFVHVANMGVLGVSIATSITFFS